jgi:hypothetical protein
MLLNSSLITRGELGSVRIKKILKSDSQGSHQPQNSWKFNLYEYTIKALDENGVVVGIGKKAKKCCKMIDE